MSNRIFCVHEQANVRRVDDHYSSDFPVLRCGLADGNDKTLDRVIADMLVSRIVGAEIACPNCNRMLKDPIASQKFLGFPEVLLIQIQRTENVWDGQKMVARVNRAQIDIPKILDLTRHLDGAVSKKECNGTFRLIGWLSQSGTTNNEGHYRTFVRTNRNQWYRVDDLPTVSTNKRAPSNSKGQSLGVKSISLSDVNKKGNWSPVLLAYRKIHKTADPTTQGQTTMSSSEPSTGNTPERRSSRPTPPARTPPFDPGTSTGMTPERKSPRSTPSARTPPFARGTSTGNTPHSGPTPPPSFAPERHAQPSPSPEKYKKLGEKEMRDEWKRRGIALASRKQTEEELRKGLCADDRGEIYYEQRTILWLVGELRKRNKGSVKRQKQQMVDALKREDEEKAKSTAGNAGDTRLSSNRPATAKDAQPSDATTTKSPPHTSQDNQPTIAKQGGNAPDDSLSDARPTIKVELQIMGKGPGPRLPPLECTWSLPQGYDEDLRLNVDTTLTIEAAKKDKTKRPEAVSGRWVIAVPSLAEKNRRAKREREKNAAADGGGDGDGDGKPRKKPKPAPKGDGREGSEGESGAGQEPSARAPGRSAHRNQSRSPSSAPRGWPKPTATARKRDQSRSTTTTTTTSTRGARKSSRGARKAKSRGRSRDA